MFFKKKIGDDGKDFIDIPNNQNIFLNKIKKNLSSRKRFKKSIYYKLFIYFLVLFFLIISFKTFAYFFDISAGKISQFLFKPVVAELEKDENGFVNILLIGAGGGDHDGADLTDTMIIASIDLNSKSIVMLSIPRDFYVNYDKRYSGSRINEIFRDMFLRISNLGVEEDVAREQARKILAKEIEEISGMKIPYFLQIDFAGFEKIVNALGGIDIDVPESIVDTTYPDGNWGYETFSIKKGPQHLDGEIALKYARSRHSSSDFDRAARQQMIISAIKDKALSSEILTSPYKIKKLFGIASDNIETNFEFSEIFTLASFSGEFSRDSIYNAVLNDDWNTRGGFLGTPPRVDYGGAFVLIPYSGEGDYSRIQLFSDFIFKNRDFSKLSFEVLNSTTGVPGVATKVGNRLTRYGMNINSVGNGGRDDVLEKTEVIVYSSKFDSETFKNFWDEIFPGVEISFVDKVGYYEETNIDVTIKVGNNIRF